MNKIKNAGFEADWGEAQDHLCLVCPRTEPNYFKEVGNVFVPPYWTFWFRHQAGEYDQPEGRDSWKQNAPERVRSGDKAYMWFTFNRRHDAGLYQQVSVVAGAKMRFTAWAHAWSNGLSEADGGKPDDGLWSDGAGFQQVAWEYGSQPVTGDKWQDAKSNFTFWVGIDPSGATDPFGSGVIWSEGYHIYNGYVKQLEVEATALSDTVTVFIRSKTRFAFKHNDAYVDDAELTIIGEQPPQQDEITLHLQTEAPKVGDNVLATAISQTELSNVKFSVAVGGKDFPVDTTDYWESQGEWFWETEFNVQDEGLHSLSVESDTCSDVVSFEVFPKEPARGAPREQYERMYYLLPKGANSKWARAVVNAVWDKEHPTIGGSADDLGIGDLDVRRGVCINPRSWDNNGNTIEDFFPKYYPGVDVVYITAKTPEELEGKLGGNPTPPPDPILLGQADSPWGSLPYADGCPTFAAAGCWLTDCAMALRYFEIDKDATPLSVAQKLSVSDFSDCSMLWTAMPKIGLRVVKSTGDAQEAIDHLIAGGVAFAEVMPGAGKHFVMVTDFHMGDWKMYDPLKRVTGWLFDHYDEVESWRLISPAGGRSFLVGLHDEAGGKWMVDNGISGVCLVHEIVQKTAKPLDFRYLQSEGITVICRLNWGYAGGTGTLPRPEDKDAFISAVVQTILSSQGVDYWHVGNEPNNRSEWSGFNQALEDQGAREYEGLVPLTPEYVVEIYNEIWDRIRPEDKMGPPPIDPYFGPGSNNRVWWTYILSHIAGADAIFLHAKTQTNDPDEVYSEAKFSDWPLEWQYLHLMTASNAIDDVNARADFRGLPVYVTELNPQFLEAINGPKGWKPGNADWIDDACEFFTYKEPVDGVVFYRYEAAGDQAMYGLEDKPVLLQAIKEEAGA